MELSASQRNTQFGHPATYVEPEESVSTEGLVNTCPTLSSSAHRRNPSSGDWGPPLVPPLGFACVVGTGIYRGGFPKPMFLPFLNHLELRTVVSITPDPLPEHICSHLQERSATGIKFVHIAGAAEQKKSKKKRGVPITRDVAENVLNIITDRAAQPVFLHCSNGRQTTSLIVACLRIKQGWSVRSVFSEYAHFSDYDRKDVLFVEEFAVLRNVDL